MDNVKFVAATNNKNKLKEFARILEPLNIEVLTVSQCGGENIDPVEDGETFEANAIIKAKAFAEALGMPALADDSGLCVDALDGAPGVYSARYSGEGDAANNALLLKNLEGVPMEKRTARFVCAICCAYPDGRYFTVRGECEGKIGFEPKGSDGFGYDPLFFIETGESFAEISGARKDSMSHRGKALRLLAERLEENEKLRNKL
ncbi:MAG: XTP/dITP diphosphatase [Acutalibacteraceae bacterium]